MSDLREQVEALRQIDLVRLDSVDLRRELEPSTLLVRDDVLALIPEGAVVVPSLAALRLTYDPAADAAYVYFTDHKVDHTEEVSESGTNVDYDADGRLVGIEFLDVLTHKEAYPE